MNQEPFYTPTIRLLPKSKVKRTLLFLGIAFMSMHSIYTTIFKGLGLDHYDRHKALIEERTMFYNPWQYRIMVPLIVEGVHAGLNMTLFKVIDANTISQKFNNINLDGKDNVTKQLIVNCQKTDYLKYLTTFIFVRWILNFFLFSILILYWRHFTNNNYLVYFSLFFFSLVLGNSINDCDFSFNTIMDVIIYLFFGLLILRKWHSGWLVLIAAIGSFNRETSILIPGLYFLNQVDFKQLITRKLDYLKELIMSKATLNTVTSYAIFFTIFIGIRTYFGYVPAEQWRVPAGLPMLKLNLLSQASVKSYFEMYGTFMFLPFVICLWTRYYSKYLQVMYWTVVPLWIFIHLWMVVAYQSRLFLVPTALILFPMCLELISRKLNSDNLS